VKQIPEILRASDWIEIDGFWQFVQANFPGVKEREILKTSDFVEAVFGFTANTYELSKFHTDLISGALPAPHIAIAPMKPGQLACYQTESIYLNQRLLLDAFVQPELMWVVFYALLHDCGHHLDDVLHLKYLNDRGDTARDEGAGFASRFVDWSGMNLLVNNFEFGEAEWETADGKKRRGTLAVGSEAIEAYRKLALHYATLHSGEEEGELVAWGESRGEAEFWNVEGKGSVHEVLSKLAAQANHLPFKENGDGLDEGCAWPDVPEFTGKENNTNYGKFLSIYIARSWFSAELESSRTYNSHFGNLQNWHSMCPEEKGRIWTNKEVKQLILEHLKGWYQEALTAKKESDALFNMGRMMHTVQDGYCLSHCWRRFVDDGADYEKIPKEHEWKIWSFQSYGNQDSSAHGVADKAELEKNGEKIQTLGYRKSIEASSQLLSFYKNKATWNTILQWLDTEVYVLYPGREEMKSGYSHPWFSKALQKSSEWVENKMAQLSKKVGSK
jgi:hypothetical protein